MNSVIFYAQISHDVSSDPAVTSQICSWKYANCDKHVMSLWDQMEHHTPAYGNLHIHEQICDVTAGLDATSWLCIKCMKFVVFSKAGLWFISIFPDFRIFYRSPFALKYFWGCFTLVKSHPCYHHTSRLAREWTPLSGMHISSIQISLAILHMDQTPIMVPKVKGKIKWRAGIWRNSRASKHDVRSSG